MKLKKYTCKEMAAQSAKEVNGFRLHMQSTRHNWVLAT